MSDETMRVEVANGKYTVIQEANGRLKVLRYGEAWVDETGNKFLYCMAQELQDAREGLKKAIIDIQGYHIDWALMNNQSPDYDKNYKPSFPAIVAELEALLPKVSQKP